MRVMFDGRAGHDVIVSVVTMWRRVLLTLAPSPDMKYIYSK